MNFTHTTYSSLVKRLFLIPVPTGLQARRLANCGLKRRPWGKTPGLGTGAHGLQGRQGDRVLELTVGARPLGQEPRRAVLNGLVTCGTEEVAALKLLVETVVASGQEQV